MSSTDLQLPKPMNSLLHVHHLLSLKSSALQHSHSPHLELQLFFFPEAFPPCPRPPPLRPILLHLSQCHPPKPPLTLSAGRSKYEDTGSLTHHCSSPVSTYSSIHTLTCMTHISGAVIDRDVTHGAQLMRCKGFQQDQQNHFGLLVKPPKATTAG